MRNINRYVTLKQLFKNRGEHLANMKVNKLKNLRAIVALASTLVLAISFGMARPIMAIADNRLPNEQSTANWPDTKGEQLATSDYEKKETLDFSTDYVFPKDYAATPNLISGKNLSLFIHGKETNISELPSDGTNGKPKSIMTNQMGTDTYFKAASMMTVLIDGKYEVLDMKVTLKGVDLSNENTSVAFGVKGPGEGGNLFLSSGSGQQIAQRGNFTNMHYQFFKHGTDIPVAAKFHMGFTDLDNNEALKLDENVINKVYVDKKSTLPYQIINGQLAITRDYDKPVDIKDSIKSQTHVVVFDLDVPADGFDISIATSGHGKNPNAITPGSKISPSILTTMLYQGTVTTQYVDENNEPLQDPTTTSDIIGKDYKTTKPDEITKDGIVYVLVPEKNPTNADGKYIDGNTEVTYTYKKKEGTVVTKFVDEAGNPLKEPTTTTDVIGKDYKTTKPDEITKDGIVYVLVPEKNPTNADGKYIDGNTEVTYTYKKKETPAPKTGTVITHFVDEAGNKLAVDTAITDIVGNDYKTTGPSTITKDGIVYVLVPEKNPANAEGKYIDGNTEVTYTYKKKEGTVVTKFVDEDGNPLKEPTTTTDVIGKDYKTTKPDEITKDGIIYVLVPEKNPTNADGKYIDGNTEVTYTYKKKETPAPKTGTVITHFVDEAGNKLAVDTEITDLVGNDYKTVAPSIITKDGIVYVLIPEKNPANAEGKYIDGNTEVTYTYKKKETPAPKTGTVITHFVDEAGNKLAVDTEITDIVGNDYKTTGPSTITKDGIIYVLVPEKNPTNADGKYIDGNTEVTYTYKKKETPAPKTGTVITHFVDEAGNKLAVDTAITDLVGNDYNTVAPSIITKDGIVYVLVPEKNPANAEGKYIDGNTEVTYTYKKKETPAPKTGTVITHFVDEAGNKLAVDTAITDIVGNDYNTVAPSTITKDGIVYVLVPEKNPTNADGKYIDGNTEVTYTYKKKETPAPKTGTVITHFVDEAGNKLAVDTAITDIVGNDYKTTGPSTITKDGIVYVLVPEKNPANAEGKYIDGNTEVTYTYKKKETPAPPVPSTLNTPNTPNTPKTTGQLTSVVSLPLTGENTSFLSVLGFLLMSILGLMHLKTRRKN